MVVAPREEPMTVSPAGGRIGRRVWPEIAAVATGLLLTAVATLLIWRSAADRRAAELAVAADSYAVAVERRLATGAQVPRALAALVEAQGGSVGRDAYESFVANLLNEAPSLVITGWFPATRLADVPTFETRLASEGYARARVHGPDGCDPAAAARPLFPTARVAPLAGNEGVIGFDIGCMANRLAAVERARDTGRTSATSRLVLVSPPGVSAVNLYAPVYREAVTGDSVAARREAFVGAVGVAMRLDLLVGDVFAPLVSAPLFVSLHDLDAPPADRLLLEASAQTRTVVRGPLPVDPAAAPLERRFDFAGRRWLLRFEPLPGALAISPLLPGLVLMSGVLATFVASGALWMLRQRALQAASAAAHAAKLNRVLRDSEERMRRILDNLFAFVGILEPDGTVLEANRAPLRAAGLDISDVRGKKFWDCFWWSHDPAIQADLEAAVARARAGETVRYDVPVRIAGDGRIIIDFQLAPARD